MIRKLLYHVLFAANIIALVLAIVQFVLIGKGYTENDLESYMMWRMNITVFVFLFLIWNIIIWSKRDKKITRFFALFFLPGLYTFYYYNLVIKNKWLNKQD